MPYWQTQFGGGELSVSTLQAYLALVDRFSRVFNEARDASTIEKAYAILSAPRDGRTVDRFDQLLLTAWLNVADGAIGYDQLVDTDGDGQADTPFATALDQMETIRLNSSVTDAELTAQRVILERLYR